MSTKNVLIFAGGFMLGSLITFHYTKQIITERAEEEIESVKRAFRKERPDEKKPSTIETSTIDNYGEFLKKCEYTPYAGDEQDELKVSDHQEPDCPVEEGPMDDDLAPRVVDPDDFCENEEYGVYTFTYYADGVLTDDEDNLINKEDWGDLVGDRFFDYFGSNVNDPDTVYIINQRTNNYYEIQFNYNQYEDVVLTKPRELGVD